MEHNVRCYSKSFYPMKIIESAIQSYRKLAVINVSEEGELCICHFSDCVVDPERIMLEFDNYLIELLNTSGTSVDA